MTARPDAPPEPWNPAQLVARIRAGDHAAEEELVARYSRGISVILRRAAGFQPAADDLYQDVFLRAVEKIRAGEVRDPERLSGFITSLARNMAIDYFRRNPPVDSLTDSDEEMSVPDRRAGPLERVLRIEDARCVRQVMAELPSARDRQLLFSFYLDGEDKERICANLKLTSLQFNRVLHRARERFRELYQRAARPAPRRREG
jgi:RNA polymerase sigma-70 factor (ECF subfamily)